MDTLDIILIFFFFLLFGLGSFALGFILREIKNPADKTIEIEVYSDNQITLTMNGNPVFTGRIVGIDTRYQDSLHGDSSADIRMVSESKYMEAYSATGR